MLHPAAAQRPKPQAVFRGRGRGSGPRVARAAAPPSATAAAYEDPARTEDVMVHVPNAFEISFSAHSRVRARGRQFCIGGCTFVVVERTIGGLDDVVYSKHRDVWEHLPRGNARVFVPSTDAATQYTLVASLNGLRKFGYGESTYGLERDVVCATSVEKENGECGHLAAFAYLGERYWIVGSKNVHMVLRFGLPEEDLRVYTGVRYSYAQRIARLWRETIATRRLTADQQMEFHTRLAQAQWTSCFESILANSQHLVDYGGANEMRFYAVTVNGVPAAEALCLPVEDAEAFYRSVGLYFSAHSARLELGTPAYQAELDAIARRGNSEGSVLYGYNRAGQVVRLWKQKSYPYVMERAAREAITTNKLAGYELRQRLERKLAMQPPELRAYFSDWAAERMPWLVRLAAWLQITKIITPAMDRAELFAVRNRWLTLQKSFGEALEEDGELLVLCDSYQPDSGAWGDASGLDVIKFVGAQGCGKSTLSRALFVLLTEAGCRPRWVNQDEAGNRGNYLASIRQATAPRAAVSHLLLDKMNLDERTNQDYKHLPLTLTVAWTHVDGTRGMLEECLNRIFRRGSGHRTIRVPTSLPLDEQAVEKQKIRKFVSGAVRSCRVPEGEDSLVELDMQATLAEMLHSIWGRLQERGVHAIPDLSTLHVDAAVTLSQRYEALLCELPKAPIYAAISVEHPPAVLAVVPPSYLEGKVVQKTFHVTTKYFVGDPDPIMFVQLAELLGTPTEVTLVRVVSDAKGTAIVVQNEGQFPCGNAVAHITVANAPGIPPKYSNDLLSDAYGGNPSDRASMELPPGVVVRGTFQFY